MLYYRLLLKTNAYAKVIHNLSITNKVEKFLTKNYPESCEKRCLKFITKKGLTFLVVSECCIILFFI